MDSFNDDNELGLALRQGRYPYLRKVDKDICFREVTSSGEIVQVEASLRKLLYFLHLCGKSIDTRTPTPSLASRLRKPHACVLKNESNDCAIGLRVRDLRRLDFFFKPNQESSIWVRKVRICMSIPPSPITVHDLSAKALGAVHS